MISPGLLVYGARIDTSSLAGSTTHLHPLSMWLSQHPSWQAGESSIPAHTSLVTSSDTFLVSQCCKLRCEKKQNKTISLWVEDSNKHIGHWETVTVQSCFAHSSCPRDGWGSSCQMTDHLLFLYCSISSNYDKYYRYRFAVGRKAGSRGRFFFFFF